MNISDKFEKENKIKNETLKIVSDGSSVLEKKRELIESSEFDYDGDAEGWAVVPLDVKVNGDVVDYYYDIYVGDVAADPYATDDALILDLEQYGNHNTPLTMSYCYFNEVLTLVYFSKDADDNNSEVTKVKFTLRPENCSPVSEFNYGKPGTAQAKSLRRFTE